MTYPINHNVLAEDFRDKQEFSQEDARWLLDSLQKMCAAYDAEAGFKIKFSDDATTATFASACNDMREWTVNITITNNTGYFERSVIKGANEQDGLEVWEADENGSAIRNSTQWIPWHLIEEIVIL